MVLLLFLNNCTKTVYVDRYIESPSPRLELPSKTDISVLDEDVNLTIYPIEN